MTRWRRTPSRAVNYYSDPPPKLLGLLLLAVIAVIGVLVFIQFRGGFSRTTPVTVMSGRSGLVLDLGAKVTYNGVPVGRVSDIVVTQEDGTSKARLTAEIGSRFLHTIPANVRADVVASTIFGNKYLEFSSPETPSVQRISRDAVITAETVTTEFQTMFETVTGLAEKIDPVQLNQTMSAMAEALTGLGTKFGRSLVEGNAILDDANQRIPALRQNLRRVAELSDIYNRAGPDLWDAVENSLSTARTLNGQQSDLDAVLLASAGFAAGATDVLERGAPYLIRAAADLVPSSQLLNAYSPAIFCTIRNTAELVPDALAAFGGNGYSLSDRAELIGPPNPYVYPDNLPRVNGHGGPGGAPGCWQKVTRDFWPAPNLVVDDGASIAPYNHFELGQPILTEYVWGRQVGENTINP
ncbi:MAG: MCE family protein [Mycobacterium sp.]